MRRRKSATNGSSMPLDATRRRLGRSAERLAARYLKRRGYVIEETNVRFPVGEIDIVAREGETLCLVEVRSASSLEWGGALASITARKRHRLIQAARWYLSRYRSAYAAVRFDVVAIQWTSGGVDASVELVQGAFDAS